MNRLTHLDAAGNAHMVDVSEKHVTSRSATAKAQILMLPETLALILDRHGQKRRRPCHCPHCRDYGRQKNP